MVFQTVEVTFQTVEMVFQTVEMALQIVVVGLANRGSGILTESMRITQNNNKKHACKIIKLLKI